MLSSKTVEIVSVSRRQGKEKISIKNIKQFIDFSHKRQENSHYGTTETYIDS